MHYEEMNILSKKVAVGTVGLVIGGGAGLYFVQIANAPAKRVVVNF